ncbi:MAG: hypothetical protein LRY73_02115 [Bacillus sp. (in: Bacteria)]|nr:hypothetical protein [Bacillus sp. (in: firmicutes)]
MSPEEKESFISDEKAKEIERQTEHSSTVRDLKGIVKIAFVVIAVVGAILHLVILNFYPIDPWLFRVIHLAFGAVLALMLFKGSKKSTDKVSIVDWLLIAAIIFVTGYIYMNLTTLCSGSVLCQHQWIPL